MLCSWNAPPPDSCALGGHRRTQWTWGPNKRAWAGREGGHRPALWRASPWGGRRKAPGRAGDHSWQPWARRGRQENPKQRRGAEGEGSWGGWARKRVKKRSAELGLETNARRQSDQSWRSSPGPKRGPPARSGRLERGRRRRFTPERPENLKPKAGKPRLPGCRAARRGDAAGPSAPTAAGHSRWEGWAACSGALGCCSSWSRAQQHSSLAWCSHLWPAEPHWLGAGSRGKPVQTGRALQTRWGSPASFLALGYLTFK